MRKFPLLLSGIALSTLAFGTIPEMPPFVSFLSAYAQTPEVGSDLQLFGDTFEKTRMIYVEEPEEKKMIEAAINGMLTSLDPYSSYIDAKTYREKKTHKPEDVDLVGLELTQQDGMVKVVTPIEGMAAFKAGILGGDLITAIDDEKIQGMPLDAVRSKIRGGPNSSVTLNVLRGSKRETKKISVKREALPIVSVSFRKENKEQDVGYIRISQFNAQTFAGVKEALEKLMEEIPKEKFKGFLLDLRNNPGGSDLRDNLGAFHEYAVAVAAAFMDKGEIVSLRGRKAEDTQHFYAHDTNLSGQWPIVVLINGGTASASEIVAGALQEHKRAILLGTNSFGKGVVQSILPLPAEAGALRLTTASYFTPFGKSIHLKAIQPDIRILQDVPDELKDMWYFENDSGRKKDEKILPLDIPTSQAYVPLKAEEDAQLQAGIDLISGKKTFARLQEEADLKIKQEKDRLKAQRVAEEKKEQPCVCPKKASETPSNSPSSTPAATPPQPTVPAEKIDKETPKKDSKEEQKSPEAPVPPPASPSGAVPSPMPVPGAPLPQPGAVSPPPTAAPPPTSAPPPK